MKVLVVDDERHFCDYLSRSLAREGYQVATAHSGREAIDVGTHFRPNVLVTDWMLKNHLHGIHVSRALQAVDPELQTILVTGYPSDDLEADADRADVFRLLRKPFRIQEVLTAVQTAAQTPPAKRSPSRFAVIQIDAAGAIVFANSEARKLLAAICPSGVDNFHTLLEPDQVARLHKAEAQWLEVVPRSAEPVRWFLRSKQLPDQRVVLVILPQNLAQERNNPVIRMLLAANGPEQSSWPFDDHVLIIDDEQVIRALQTRLLERIGCACFAAGNEELALRLFEDNPKIGVVILDYAMPDFDLGQLIAKLRAIRPTIKIVGNSGQASAGDFAALGVHRFLQKPWRVSELVHELAKPET
jgi:DNA-binding NtrC family response regulator